MPFRRLLLLKKKKRETQTNRTEVKKRSRHQEMLLLTWCEKNTFLIQNGKSSWISHFTFLPFLSSPPSLSLLPLQKTFLQPFDILSDIFINDLFCCMVSSWEHSKRWTPLGWTPTLHLCAQQSLLLESVAHTWWLQVLAVPQKQKLK